MSPQFLPTDAVLSKKPAMVVGVYLGGQIFFDLIRSVMVPSMPKERDDPRLGQFHT